MTHRPVLGGGRSFFVRGAPVGPIDAATPTFAALIFSAKRSSTRLRSRGCCCAHTPDSKARRAACTARSTSAGWQAVFVAIASDYRALAQRLCIDDVVAVPLSAFATTRWVVGPMQTVRYNGYPAMRISGSAAPGYSTGAALADSADLRGLIALAAPPNLLDASLQQLTLNWASPVTVQRVIGDHFRRDEHRRIDLAAERAGRVVVGDVDGVVIVPRAQAEAVLAMAQEIDARELEQAKLIIAEKSLRKGLAKYGRI